MPSPFPSLPFPVSLIGRKAQSATNSLLYNLQRLSVSRVLPGGTMAGSAIHAGSAPELPCRWPTTVVCSRMFMTRAAGGLVLAAPFSNRVFQEFLLLLHEAWATVFALSRVLWVRASTKVERFFSQSGTIVAAHGTAYGPRILAKRNGSRANLERSSLKPGRSRDSLSMER